MNKALFFSIFLLPCCTAWAQNNTVNIPTLTADTASNLVKHALESCKKNGYHVSAAVVDRTGSLKAFIRSEYASPHTVSSAEKKAFTAASMGQKTTDLEQRIAKNPAMEGLRDLDSRLLMSGGGIPIKVNGQVVAGIGVGGAPGGHLDDACAESAIATVLK